MHEGTAVPPEAAVDEQEWFTADSKNKVKQNLLMFQQPDLSPWAECHKGMFLGCEGHQALCSAEVVTKLEMSRLWPSASIHPLPFWKGESIDSLGRVWFRGFGKNFVLQIQINTNHP